MNQLTRSHLAAAALCFALTAGTASADVLTTIFAQNNNAGPDSVVMFDITVLNPAGITITSVDVNMNLAGRNFTLDVYTTPTTYVGNQFSPAAWTLVASGTGVSQATNTPTPVNISDFLLGPGVYGLAFFTPGSPYQQYTNGANTYSNANLSISTGASTNDFFATQFNRPRTWNGSIYYNVTGTPEPSTISVTAAGLLGLVALARRRRRSN